MTSKSEEKILRSIETFFLSYFDFVDQGKFPGKKIQICTDKFGTWVQSRD